MRALTYIHKQAGYNSCTLSNLARGAWGWQAIDEYMIDNGDLNGAAGHRRWITYVGHAFSS
jgi:hypothetical protein